MLRHADGCGDLWHKQTGHSSSSSGAHATTGIGNGFHSPPSQSQHTMTKKLLLPPPPHHDAYDSSTTADKSDISSSVMSGSTSTGTAGSVATATSGGSSSCATAVSRPAKPAPLVLPPNEWVVIPNFADIVRLAVIERDDCQTK